LQATRRYLGSGFSARTQRAAELAENLRELAGDDPDLVRLALGELGQRLHVLVGEQLRVRLALGAEDCALLRPFGLENLRLLDALGVQDRRALVPVGAHLLLHRLLNGGRRVDRLQLDPIDADAPLPSRLVEDAAKLRVYLVARGERLLEVEASDHVAKGRHGELFDRLDVVRDLVGRRLRLGDLKVDDRVDADDEVVLGDHGLRCERHHLLPQIDHFPDPIDERHDDRESGAECPRVTAEPLDDPGACLRDDPDRPRQRDQDEHRNYQQNNQRHHQNPLFEYERGRALDFRHFNPHARLEYLLLEERSRRPLLAADPHAAAVGVHALQYQRRRPDERRGTRSRECRHPHVAPRDRPKESERSERHADEDEELENDATADPGNDGRSDCGQRHRSEEEHPRRQQLTDREQCRSNQPDDKPCHVSILTQAAYT
jgi:hypothetical protein